MSSCVSSPGETVWLVMETTPRVLTWSRETLDLEILTDLIWNQQDGRKEEQ